MTHSPQQRNSPGARPKILIVEDDGVVALELQSRLTALGYEVPDFASTGEQAIQLIEQRRPDLVLMDIVLAGAMKGTEAAKLIRERFQTPVIYLTAYSDSATIEEIKE